MTLFLGGIWFAILLIFLTALFAALGSFTNGIYENLFFKALLVGFFLNILISALRRYPFKKRHIPFLLTHLGLLVLISSLFIKAVFGLQATIPLDLHSPSHIAYIPEKLLIELQTKQGEKVLYPAQQAFTFNQICFKPLALYPHSKAVLTFWHDGSKATVMGVGTIPFFDTKEDTVPLRHGPWHIYALRTKTCLPPYTLAIYEDCLCYTLPDGSHHKVSIDPQTAPLYIFEEGFGGYGTLLTLEGTTFWGPLFIKIHKEEKEGERALVLEASDGKIYTLQEGVAPLPVAGMLARIMPASFELPFSLTLEETYQEKDVCFAQISLAGEKYLLSSQQGASYKNYDFFLSFWDKNHVSLVISKDPLKKVLLYIGIAIMSLGVILLLGKRK